MVKKKTTSENPLEPVVDANTSVFYVNYAAVQTTAEEFIFRYCLRNLDGAGTPIEVVRIYLSPGHAKRLLLALAQTLQTHEALFGEIQAQPTMTTGGKKMLEDQKKKQSDAAKK